MIKPEGGKGYIIEFRRDGSTERYREIALYYGDNEWGSLGSDYMDLTIGSPAATDNVVLALIDPDAVALITP